MWKGVGRCARMQRRCTSTSGTSMPLPSLVLEAVGRNSSHTSMQQHIRGVHDGLRTQGRLQVLPQTLWPCRTTSPRTSEHIQTRNRTLVAFVVNRLQQSGHCERHEDAIHFHRRFFCLVDNCDASFRSSNLINTFTTSPYQTQHHLFILNSLRETRHRKNRRRSRISLLCININHTTTTTTIKASTYHHTTAA